MKRVIDFEGLKEWLETLDYNDFHENMKIIKGTSECDVERFNKNKMDIKLGEMIFYGDDFLVDDGGHVTVATLSRRKYKITYDDGRWRVARLKIRKRLLEMNKFTVNGYWIIPDKFCKEVR